MKLIPNVLQSAIFVGIVALLDYLLKHVGSFGLPDLYVPLIAMALTTLIKLVTEYKPSEPEALARGESGPRYWERVLYK